MGDRRRGVVVGQLDGAVLPLRVFEQHPRHQLGIGRDPILAAKRTIPDRHVEIAAAFGVCPHQHVGGERAAAGAV
jgi:hypothetical protein